MNTAFFLSWGVVPYFNTHSNHHHQPNEAKALGNMEPERKSLTRRFPVKYFLVSPCLSDREYLFACLAFVPRGPVSKGRVAQVSWHAALVLLASQASKAADSTSGFAAFPRLQMSCPPLHRPRTRTMLTADEEPPQRLIRKRNESAPNKRRPLANNQGRYKSLVNFASESPFVCFFCLKLHINIHQQTPPRQKTQVLRLATGTFAAPPPAPPHQRSPLYQNAPAASGRLVSKGNPPPQKKNNSMGCLPLLALKQHLERAPSKIDTPEHSRVV